VQVITPSSDRVEPPCRHVGDGCGGCDWQHLPARRECLRRQSFVVGQ
jgi:tRNA/tmRNA/rRNA uracil-C5-methylase (TrmA/RlmC/RlmD family)